MSDTIANRLRGLEKVEKKLAFQKEALLNKALQSANPNDLMKAQQMLSEIQQKQPTERKSFLVDPNDWQSFAGFKQKPIALTYAVLRRISYAVPIVRSIINTRIDQIASFCEPQSDRYSTGFVVRKKQGYYDSGTPGQKMTRKEHQEVESITEQIMNCGSADSWGEDDFDSFTRKVFNDSLSFDQLNFEIVPNNRGGVFEFCAVDAATIRIADTMEENWFVQGDRRMQGAEWQMRNRLVPIDKKRVKGYLPAYCQIYDNIVINDFYPWEMAFGIRNPTANIYGNGYGVSEIEILINTITSMLWGEEYNRKFFSQGSSPKGFINIKGEMGMNNEKISEFKRAWQAMMTGVTGAHKTPILQGDVTWQDLQKTNRDMEFSNWFEFLIKVSCAIYRIDPAEINFPLSGGAEQKTMFEGNNEARLKHSKDKGLRPLVKFYQRKLNKYLVSRINPAYELTFVGLDNDDPNTDIERDTKMVGSFMTVDEIRIRRGLEPLGAEGGGDIIENAVWLQNKMGAQQMAMQQQQQGAGGGMESYYGDEPNPEGEQEQIEQDDPFGKALQNYWDNVTKSN
jgi:hypothetical protein